MPYTCRLIRIAPGYRAHASCCKKWLFRFSIAFLSLAPPAIRVGHTAVSRAAFLFLIVIERLCPASMRGR